MRVFVAVLVLMVVLVPGWILFAPSGLVRWVMIDVNHSDQQGDAHLVRFPNGVDYLIDTGMTGEEVLAYLKKAKITSLDTIVISHFHKDHYGGLVTILKSIPVRRVVANVPVKAACEVEASWGGCDLPHIVDTLDQVTQWTLWESVSTGDVLYETSQLSLNVIAAYHGTDSPVGVTGLNDTSILLRLSVGEMSVFFAGDLNRKLGGYLAETRAEELRSTLLKVPHHGAESVAPDSFFEAVGAKLALVPAPKSLWESDRSRRVRAFFARRSVPVLVGGLHGTVVIDLTPAFFRIRRPWQWALRSYFTSK